MLASCRTYSRDRNLVVSRFSIFALESGSTGLWTVYASNESDISASQLTEMISLHLYVSTQVLYMVRSARCEPSYLQSR